MGEVEIRYADRDEVALVGSWITDGGDRVIGIHLHHPYDELAAGTWPRCGGGGYVAWVPGPGRIALHELSAGGPDDVEHLTLSPSLWHRAKDQGDTTLPLHANGSRCSPYRDCHGFVRNGRWVLA